jgi:hypothetical protein
MRLCVLLPLCGWLLALTQAPAPAGNDKEKRILVGRLFSPIGTVLVRENGTWSVPELYAGVAGGNPLLVLPGASGVIQVKEGDVQLTLSGRLPGLALSPVLGASATLHASKGMDLDMTLEGGRALIKNQKKDGAIKVRLRVHDDNLDLILANKDSVVGIEAYRAWPVGTPFSKKLIKDREPEIHLGVFLLQGKVELQLKTEKHSLQAPAKGAILYHLSSFGGFRGPVLLEKAPLWVKPGADKSAQATDWYKDVEYLRRRLADKKALDGVLAEMLKQKEPLKREVALLSAGALGDSKLLLTGLHDGKSGDVRRAAILALVHESNRSQAADMGVYKALIEKKYAAGQAEMVMELLHGFARKDLQRPETYESLISYLQHKDLGIRELAAWRLYQLVPQGKDIAYNAGGSAEERGTAQAAWRKLIPEGKLPPGSEK